MTVQVSDRFVDTNGIRLFVMDRGRGRALVFLHGLGWDHTLWQGVTQTFCDRYRVIAGDTRGHGRSAKPDGPYTIPLFAQDWAGALKNLRVQQACLIGFSQGGMIAQTLAVEHPEMVVALVLVSTSCRSDPAAHDKLEERIRVARAEGPVASARLAAGSVFSKAFMQAQPDAIEEFVRWRAGMDQEPLVHATRAAYGFDDPAQGVDGVMDVGIRGGRVAAVAPGLTPTPRTKTISVRGKLVLPGLIDTHAHIYEHVTGTFGLNADLVGIRSGVTTVVDQGGASPLTFNGFRNFVAEPAKSRVLSFISIYLAGGLMGHSHAGLYGPHGIDVGATVRAIEENRDLVKGIKTHAEIGGYSRWGIEVLKLAKEASRRARVPVYVHLGGMWPVVKESEPDPDSILNQVLPLLDQGDVLAHPFTRHPGAFVSASGKVHPIVTEAIMRGVRIDVGRGVHFSIEKARIVLEAGIIPFTLGADLHGYAVKRVKADPADVAPAPKGRSRGNGERLTA